MFPNSPNTNLTLLRVASTKDSLGNKVNIIKSEKNIVGSASSISHSDFQASASINVKYDLKVIIQSILYDESKFVRIRNNLYKVERTFQKGQFLELYLSGSDMEVEDG
jgi:hypothetical protein